MGLVKGSSGCGRKEPFTSGEEWVKLSLIHRQAAHGLIGRSSHNNVSAKPTRFFSHNSQWLFLLLFHKVFTAG